ncbi:MAG: TetR/AcrR family transcriptional regulator [Polyangiaceae bacterium]
MSKATKTRDATKIETRDALIAAGAMEFAEKGVDGPSLDGICARAGFTRGAFYVHFRDRDDLLVAVVDRVLVGFQTQVISTAGSAEDLETTVTRYVAAVAAGGPATRGVGKWHFRDTLAACARIPALRKRYIELQREAIALVARAVRNGQHAGTVRADVEAQSLAEILVMLTLGIGVANDVGLSFDLAGGGQTIWKLVRSAEQLAAKKLRKRK